MSTDARSNQFAESAAAARRRLQRIEDLGDRIAGVLAGERPPVSVARAALVFASLYLRDADATDRELVLLAVEIVRSRLEDLGDAELVEFVVEVEDEVTRREVGSG